MAATTYTVEEFARDVERIMGNATDRRRAVEVVKPLLARLMDSTDLLDEKYKVVSPEGRVGYRYYRSADGGLSIGGPTFLPGHPTVVHNHNTWGVIGIYTGQQRTTRYIRTDDQATPGKASLRQTEEAVLKHGDIYFLLPPDDIHRIETVSDKPSVSIHVLGVDLRQQRRTFFDLETGACREVEGEPVMA